MQRKFPMLLSAFVWLASLFPAINYAASSSPDDVPTLAQTVDRHYNQLRTLQAEFTEIYHGAGMDRTESGTLWLKRPGRMRWEYRTPRQKLFLTDGKNAWFYLPGQRQARKTSFRKLEDLRSPLGYLLGKTKLEKEFQGLSLAVDVKPLTAGNRVLRGVPKVMGARITQVLLEVAPGGRIDRIVAEDADGATTEYRFGDQKEGLPIADQRFRFSPPAGVEMVEGEVGQ